MITDTATNISTVTSTAQSDPDRNKVPYWQAENGTNHHTAPNRGSMLLPRTGKHQVFRMPDTLHAPQIDHLLPHTVHSQNSAAVREPGMCEKVESLIAQSTLPRIASLMMLSRMGWEEPTLQTSYFTKKAAIYICKSEHVEWMAYRPYRQCDAVHPTTSLLCLSHGQNEVM